MTLEELFEDIDNDFNINLENLGEKMFKVPGLHSKYLRLFFQHKSKLNKYNEELQKLYKAKYYYFTEEYEYKLDNAKEINFHIYSDEDYSKLNLKVENQKLLVDCLDRTLKKVQYLTNDIRNIQEWHKYLAGV